LTGNGLLLEQVTPLDEPPASTKDGQAHGQPLPMLGFLNC